MLSIRGPVALVALGLVVALGGCAGQAPVTPSEPAEEPATAEPAIRETDERKAAEMRLAIDGTDVMVEWEDNQAVADLRALAAASPLTVELSMYGGFEQVGPLGTSLTASDVHMTTGPGDIVLYASNQISVFYGQNSWAYTKLGHIADRTAEELAELLGNGDVSITIAVE